MSRKIKIIFTLSILLNVILLGVVGGGMLRVYKHFGHSDFRKEMESLPEDVQQRIDQAFNQSRQEMRELFSEAREAKETVRESLNAESFNPQTYQDAVERLNQIRYRMLQAQSKKTGTIAAELNAEERRRFAGYLMRGGHKRGFRTREDRREDFRERARTPDPVMDSGAEESSSSQRREEPFDPVMLPMPNFNN